MRKERLMFLVYFILTVACTQVENEEAHFEQNAVRYVMDSLMKTDAMNKFDLDGYFQDFSEANQIYSNGKLCLISTPYEAFISANPSKFKADFQSKKGVLGSTSFTLPGEIKLLEWSKYLEGEKDKSFYIYARHNIRAGDEVLVEVNLTAPEYLPNPSQFTFFILMDKGGKIKKWKFVLKDDFDIELDC